MALFTWDDDLSVGNTMIDSDHRRLIDLFNKLHDAMGEGQGAPLIGEVLTELFDYASSHFSREEAYMHQLMYVGFTAHKKEHQLLLQRVRELHEDYLGGTLSLSVPTLTFLYEWLLNHIMESDRALADTVQKSAH